MSSTIRSFIGLVPPADLLDSLSDLSARIAAKDKVSAVRWLMQDNYHLTLAFLGEQPLWQLESLMTELDFRFPRETIPIEITELSTFPPSRPKVFAAMAASTDRLMRGHNAVVAALRASHLDVTSRRFRPHITLGRFSSHKKSRPPQLPPLAVTINSSFERLALYRSHLLAGGAEYEIVDEISLLSL